MSEPRQYDYRETTATAMTRLAALTMGVALAVLLVAPRAAPLLLLAAAIPALSRAELWEVTAEELGQAPIVMCLIFVLYLAVSTLWAIDRLEAAGKVALAGAIVMTVWLSWRGFRHMSDEAVTYLGHAAMIALLLGLAYLAAEELTEHRIKRAAFNLLPFLRPSAKHIALEGDVVGAIEVYLSNRSMGALALTTWPMLAVIGWHRTWPSVMALAVLVLVTCVVVISSHETSAIALAASALVALVALRWRRLAFVLVAVGWTAATLLVVPIVSHPLVAGLHAAEWLPKSARHRFVLWEYTAEQVWKAPALGIGIGSGKILDERRERRDPPPGYRFERRAGTHAHNVYLQTWYELGGAGAMLLFAAGLSLLASIGRLAPDMQPTALATFVAAAATAGFSWGMWQPWFMALFGMTGVLLLLAIEAVRRRASPPGIAPAAAEAGEAEAK